MIRWSLLGAIVGAVGAFIINRLLGTPDVDGDWTLRY